MDQWSNGPMDQWNNGPMEQWTNGPMDQLTNGPMDQSTNRPMDKSTSGPMDQRDRRDECTCGLMDQWSNGPMVQWSQGFNQTCWRPALKMIRWSKSAFLAPKRTLGCFWPKNDPPGAQMERFPKFEVVQSCSGMWEITYHPKSDLSDRKQIHFLIGSVIKCRFFAKIWPKFTSFLGLVFKHW